MAEEKEQLKIEATLDTSKLKQQARQGLNEVVNEEKKVENQARQTSRAVDAIGTSGKSAGNALQQAGSQGTQALKQVGSQADIAKQKINDIAKATQGIRLQQALGVANQFASSLAPVGQALGESLGMSQGDIDTAGGMISGSLRGAAAGAALGPLGAAAGALVGAGTALITAGRELQRAADTQLKNLQATKEGVLADRAARVFDNKVTSLGDADLQDLLARERQKAAEAARQIDRTLEANPVVNSLQYDYVPGQGQVIREGAGRDNEATAQRAKEIEEKLAAAVERREKALERIARIEGELARRNALPVGPEIPEYIRMQRDAEANAFVGPIIPDEIRQQREKDAQEAEARDRAFDSYRIEQRRERVRDIQDNQLKPAEEMLGRLSGMKLSDSLTSIGGGSGYGVQMQGINRIAGQISSEVTRIKALIQSELAAIQELANKWKPYYGEFISQQDN